MDKNSGYLLRYSVQSTTSRHNTIAGNSPWILLDIDARVLVTRKVYADTEGKYIIVYRRSSRFAASRRKHLGTLDVYHVLVQSVHERNFSVVLLYALLDIGVTVQHMLL